MKKLKGALFLTCLGAFFWLFFSQRSQAFSIDQMKTVHSGQMDPEKIKELVKKDGVEKCFTPLVRAPFKYETIETDPLYLQCVARDTLEYINRFQATHKHVFAPRLFSQRYFGESNVKKTLEFIIKAIENDKKKGKFRINDPDFIARNFSCIKWSGDYETALKRNDIFFRPGKIRLTQYAVFQFPGRYEKTKEFCKPLMSLPFYDDELKVVRSGVLAWLTEAGYKDALMQGTVFVKMSGNPVGKTVQNGPNNAIKAFRLHLPQKMSAYKTMKDSEKVFYFCEIKGNQFKELYTHCIQRKGIVFAGDIYNIGIGKIIALSYLNPKTKKPEMRLGVMADTGGAFVKNLYKLDYFAGIFSSREDFRKSMGNLPTVTDAYILYKK
ncbi:MAG: hypothetical protein ABH827_02805 [bacterium]